MPWIRKSALIRFVYRDTFYRPYAARESDIIINSFTFSNCYFIARRTEKGFRFSLQLKCSYSTLSVADDELIRINRIWNYMVKIAQVCFAKKKQTKKIFCFTNFKYFLVHLLLNYYRKIFSWGNKENFKRKSKIMESRRISFDWKSIFNFIVIAGSSFLII